MQEHARATIQGHFVSQGPSFQEPWVCLPVPVRLDMVWARGYALCGNLSKLLSCTRIASNSRMTVASAHDTSS